MITGVYDHVPETARMPYITLGEATEIPDNAHDRFGRQTTVTLHIWTTARGYAEGGRIADRTVALLDHRRLTIPGRRWISTRLEMVQALPDPDPRVRHHVVRFRITTTIVQEA
ncbi:DUF3168 domain-containing protein [Frankia sp. AgPm24]|uniref:DUF3168 domain-containing protein n=1 Tax=Frankia sp. AgPm24 TaxID=631128 RepID=UPI00200F492F|nr:DUF3168 domain-containing protein [Frankia sp. AgPm24]MCK9922454.1 DUF3168 domain-containing protein [Frankia sp. AgPm24]